MSRTAFDTLIIGGGLSGLTCGIALAKTGRRVAIVSASLSSLQLNGGAMELLGCVDGHEVTHPLEAIASLPSEHPYKKVGADRCGALADEAKQLLADTGIYTTGTAQKNHWRITPIGVTKPAWLSLRGMATSDAPNQLPWKRVTLLNLQGFIDFPLQLVAHNLSQLGCEVTIKDILVERICQPRRTASEMRAANLARSIGAGSKLQELADAINKACRADEVVLLPAITGMEDDYPVMQLRRRVAANLHFLATMPPSVPGTRMATMLRHYFKMLGGTYLAGDTANRAELADGHVTGVYTVKSLSTPLVAEHYVLATGTLMSQGIVSMADSIVEPLFGLDVEAPAEREQWSHYGLMGDQPFMHIGVLTDPALHAMKGGQAIDNLQAIGSILAGHNPLTMGDGSGVELLTALAVAHDII